MTARQRRIRRRHKKHQNSGTLPSCSTVFRFLKQDGTVGLAPRQQGVAYIPDTKTSLSGYAWVPMTIDLHEMLRAHYSLSNSLVVFPNPKNNGQYKERRYSMRGMCKRANVRAFVFHAIRHLSATLMAYGGIDIPSVQAVLRHKNPNTTSRYIKSLGVQHEKLDAVFSKKRGPKVTAFEPQKAIGT